MLNDLPDAQTITLTPNEQLMNDSGHAQKCYRVGGLVVLQCAVMLSPSNNWVSDELTLFTLPEGCRPSETIYIPRMLNIQATGGYMMRGIRVYPDGRIRFVNLTQGTDGVMAASLNGIMFPI